jgi:hypothetical protein
MGYYVKTLTAMETRIMQVFESCFDTMKQIEFLKVTALSPASRQLRGGY